MAEVEDEDGVDFDGDYVGGTLQEELGECAAAGADFDDQGR
ncbi:MAG: hypothetical protein ABI995_17120 [Acidobacteriota bacterium]